MMSFPSYAAALLFSASLFSCAQQEANPKSYRPAKVYGEWRIRVKLDQDEKFSDLVKEDGLPLYRAAGGRMVGW